MNNKQTTNTRTFTFIHRNSCLKLVTITNLIIIAVITVIIYAVLVWIHSNTSCLLIYFEIIGRVMDIVFYQTHLLIFYGDTIMSIIYIL
jgi:hypothetical protein